MFRKKEKKKPSLWESETALRIHYLDLKRFVNDRQKAQKLVPGGEYFETCRDIINTLRDLEGTEIDPQEELFND